MRTLKLLLLGATLALAVAPAWAAQKLTAREKRIVRKARAELDKDREAPKSAENENLKRKMQSNYD